ncbi:MAG TPA: sialidase family protein, partial [Thermoplasmata archaeon]|nr:sialidase family protein [Thermoplasmata archaeon]
SVLSGNLPVGNYCEATSTITPVNGTNSTLLMGMDSTYNLFNSTGDTPCHIFTLTPSYLSEGAAEVARSIDGGQTWIHSWLPKNTSWTTPSSTTNGSNTGLGLGSGLPTASPAVASSNNGFALFATTFSEPCTNIFGVITALNCSSAPGLQAPAGVAVARSLNGGTSFLSTAVLAQQPLTYYLTPPPACSAMTPAGYYYTNIPFGPTVAINPVSDVAVAAWQQYHQTYNGTLCAFTNVVSSIQASVSLDKGVTWSAPINVTGDQSGSPRLSVGPGPSYSLTVAYQNFLNGSRNNATGARQSNWATIRSSNNGTSWSTPSDTATTANFHELWAGSTSPGTYGVGGYPAYAVDAGSSSHSGNAYLAWSDNQSGTNGGYAAIMFQRLPAGSSSWSAAVALTPPALHSTVFFEPTLSVAPDGTLWSTFYAESLTGASGGDYTVDSVYSTDGGVTWSQISPVTTAVSIPSNTQATLGDYMGLAATSAGAYSSWMDCRSITCGSDRNTSVMVALVEPVALTSTGTGVTLTVSTNGVAQQVPLPNAIGWPIGTTHTVSAPGWLPHNATTVESFQNFTGAVNSTAFSATFNYTGGSSLVANYNFVLSAFIAGTFTPNVAGAHLTIDGYNVALSPINATTLQYNYSVASGRTYFLNASASNKYTTILNHQLGVSPGATTFYNIVLGHTNGWISGKLLPANSTLTVNGSSVAVNLTNGVYNQTLPWGSYWLNASGFGITNFSRYVPVTPGNTTSTTITLIGGWIKGTFGSSYPGATVKIDGVLVTSSSFSGVTFNKTSLGGTHSIVATAPGYNMTFLNVTVVPGHTSNVALSLTNQGKVAGIVTPAAALSTASLTINNVVKGLGGHFRIDPATGDFLVNLTGDINYTVTVTATNYVTFQTVVFVTPGKTTAPITAALTPVNKTCTSNCSPGQNNSPKMTSAGISLLLLAGIIVVVVLVAAIAAVVLMRRRGGGGGPTSSQPEETPTETTEGADTYGGPPPSS